MNTVFDFISDPGHGWLKVPYKLLETLGIQNKISHYSYRTREDAYLEEDCDAPLFLDSAKGAGIVITKFNQIQVEEFTVFLQTLGAVFRFPVTRENT